MITYLYNFLKNKIRFKQNIKKKLGVDLPAFEGNLKSKNQPTYYKGSFKRVVWIVKYYPLQKFQESLQIEILSNVVPWETEPVASIHTKVLVGGRSPRAARLKEKGK